MAGPDARAGRARHDLGENLVRIALGLKVTSRGVCKLLGRSFHASTSIPMRPSKLTQVEAPELISDGKKKQLPVTRFKALSQPCREKESSSLAGRMHCTRHEVSSLLPNSYRIGTSCGFSP